MVPRGLCDAMHRLKRYELSNGGTRCDPPPKKNKGVDGMHLLVFSRAVSDSTLPSPGAIVSTLLPIRFGHLSNSVIHCDDICLQRQTHNCHRDDRILKIPISLRICLGTLLHYA